MEGMRMRELAAVGSLVDAVLAALRTQLPCQVEVVRLRRGSSFSHTTLLRSFEIVAVGTPLEGARLAIEVVNRIVECACGRSSIVTADELLDRVWVCAVCGHAEEIDALDDLEVLDVRLAPLGAAEPAHAATR